MHEDRPITRPSRTCRRSSPRVGSHAKSRISDQARRDWAMKPSPSSPAKSSVRVLRFRNRDANKVRTPRTGRRELQGKHKIIEVVIGAWPIFPTEIAAADKRTVRAHGPRRRRAKVEIGKNTGAGEVS